MDDELCFPRIAWGDIPNSSKLKRKKGSSKEFVGEVRHRQFANCMKKHDSLSLIRVESV
jgi:hypothetical protein